MENTIRWRTVFDKEGNAVKESNAKLVRWSDGSMSLHLGAEVFDVYKQPLQVRASKLVIVCNLKYYFYSLVEVYCEIYHAVPFPNIFCDFPFFIVDLI